MMRTQRTRGRKLLVASIGVATVSYVVVAGAVSSCGGSGGEHPVGNLGIGTGGSAECAVDAHVTCTGPGVAGWTCSCPSQACDASQFNPMAQTPSLACAIPSGSSSGAGPSFCCFDASDALGTGLCTPGVGLYECTAPDQYGFACPPQTPPAPSPASADPALQCDPPTATGGTAIYCCTRP